MSNVEDVESSAVENFREYLRIKTPQPNVNYDPCVKFILKQAESLGLPCNVYRLHQEKPLIVLTWEGAEPLLPSILLSSHMDVVPVYAEKWTFDPWAAYMDDSGNIYGRGAQDMKCVGIQYLEAVRRLRKRSVILKRTVHILFTPDEEGGSRFGVCKFVNDRDFLKLNIGFALDEGVASPNDDFLAFYGERFIWYIIFHIPGQSGHGSLLHDNTAGEKLRHILDKLFDFRNQQKDKLKDSNLSIGDVTTVNLTKIEGGVLENVVPPEFTVTFDCRLPVTVDVQEWENMLNEWCKEAGEGVWIEYKVKEPQVKATSIDSSNSYWTAFKTATDQMNLSVKPQIFSGGTDSRFLRKAGIPAIGFSPMNNTPVLLHDDDEFLNKSVFLRGIDIYCNIIEAVANV